MSVEKFSAYILSPDGKYLILGVKKWNPYTGKSYSYLHYKNIETKETNILTPNIEGNKIHPLNLVLLFLIIYFSKDLIVKLKVQYIK